MNRIGIIRNHLDGPKNNQVDDCKKIERENTVSSASSPIGFRGEALLSTYDYIVVGAGSAGCIVASRLSEDPNVRVLLIEAGGSNQQFRVRSPLLTCAGLQTTDLDWKYRTEKQPLQKDRPSHWPRGKTLGGSSSINYMLYVRPDPRNFRDWVEKHGCLGWSYEECLPFMKKSEKYTGQRRPQTEYTRGREGEIHITDLNDYDHYDSCEVLDAFVNGCAAVGIPKNPDYNGPVQDGASRSQVNVDSRGRVDTATGFLFNNKAIERPNLSVLCYAHVTQILTVGDRATGVCVVINPDATNGAAHFSPPVVFQARKEIILSAGAVGTPHIMLLSGIGPRDVLEKHNIPIVKELPGVGRNLKDHLMCGVNWSCKPGKTSGFCDKEPLRLAGQLFRYFVKNEGILTIPWVQAMAFLKSSKRGENESNDLQIHFVPFVSHDDELLKNNLGIRYPEHGHLATGKHLPDHGVLILPSILQPYSSGYITLRSSNPFDHPIIEPNYMSDQRDIDAMVDCLEKCREIAKSAPMQEILDSEVVDHTTEFAPNSKEYLINQAKTSPITIYHPTSTAKMGPASDPMNVVDLNLKVHGFKNLRVADCSACPDLVSANTNSVAFLIGERCADFIKTGQ